MLAMNVARMPVVTVRIGSARRDLRKSEIAGKIYSCIEAGTLSSTLPRIAQAMATKPKTAMKKPTFTKPKGAALSGPDRTLWRPDAEAPEWLDGTLPGDAGAQL